MALALALFFLSFSPKGSKDTKLEINGKAVGVYTSSQCLFGQCGSYEVSDNDGKLLFTVEGDSYNDPKVVNKSNPDGRVVYMVWTFFETKTKVETNLFRDKKFVEEIEKYKLFDAEGKLNKTSIENMALRYGTKFSEDRKNAGGKTIIIR